MRPATVPRLRGKFLMLVTRAAVPNHALLFVPMHKAIHNCNHPSDIQDVSKVKVARCLRNLHTDDDMIQQMTWSQDNKRKTDHNKSYREHYLSHHSINLNLIYECFYFSFWTYGLSTWFSSTGQIERINVLIIRNFVIYWNSYIVISYFSQLNMEW